MEYLEQLNQLYEKWLEDFDLCPILTIPADDYELIFTEFGQAKNMLGNVVSTGLGLPITKQLVEMLVVELHKSARQNRFKMGINVNFEKVLK